MKNVCSPDVTWSLFSYDLLRGSNRGVALDGVSGSPPPSIRMCWPLIHTSTYNIIIIIIILFTFHCSPPHTTNYPTPIVPSTCISMWETRLYNSWLSAALHHCTCVGDPSTWLRDWALAHHLCSMDDPRPFNLFHTRHISALVDPSPIPQKLFLPASAFCFSDTSTAHIHSQKKDRKIEFGQNMD